MVFGVDLCDKATQVNMFIYMMGKDAEDVIGVAETLQNNSPTTPLWRRPSRSYFIPCTNIVYERTKFNCWNQEYGEPVDEFFTNLRKLADPCEYSELKEELIRDMLVVGLLNKKLSERLQLDLKLTFESAVNAVRNSKTVKREQPELREKAPTDATVEELCRSKGHPPKACRKALAKRGNQVPKLQVVPQHADTYLQTVCTMQQFACQKTLNLADRISLPKDMLHLPTRKRFFLKK